MTPNVRKHDKTCARCGADFTAAKSTARYCSGRCRRAACEERKRGTCEGCGAPTAVGSAWASRRCGNRCATCRQQADAEQHDALAARYEALWAAEKTLQEIADEMGLKNRWSAGAAVAHYRAEGRDFPYRRSEDALERLKANRWGRAAA